MGYWKYAKVLRVLTPPTKLEQPANHIPELDKYCAVFSTLGERRLGSHLLNGFQMVLKAIAQVAIEQLKADEDYLKRVLSIYPPGRTGRTLRTFTVLRGFESPTVNKQRIPLKEWAKAPVYGEKDFAALVRYATLTDKSAAEILGKVREASARVGDWGRILAKNVPAEDAALLSRALDSLVAHQAKPAATSPFNHLLAVYTRIGYETGLVKRVMQDEDICWGTFVDHSPVELHCNAHANNFAVLPQVLIFAWITVAYRVTEI